MKVIAQRPPVKPIAFASRTRNIHGTTKENEDSRGEQLRADDGQRFYECFDDSHFILHKQETTRTDGMLSLLLIPVRVPAASPREEQNKRRAGNQNYQSLYFVPSSAMPSDLV